MRTRLATRSARLASAALATTLLQVPATARAQVAASVSVESDYRIRGRSVSDKYPVASFRLGLDDASGIYTDGSASVVVTSDDGPRYLGYQFDAGFATRLGALWTLDLGIAHDDFRALYRGGRPYRRTEAYLGARRGAFSAYLFASPRYANLDSATVYGQLEATISPAPLWRVTAHAGALRLLDANAPFSSLYDWRLGASRQIGSFELHAAVSGSIPGPEAHGAGVPSRTALTAGASYSF